MKTNFEPNSGKSSSPTLSSQAKQFFAFLFEDIQCGWILPSQGAVTTIERRTEQVLGFATMPFVSEVIRHGAELRSGLLDLLLRDRSP